MSDLSISRAHNPELLQQAFSVREKVFVDEQAVPVEQEYDGLDDDATNYVGMIDEKAVSTARVRFTGDNVAKIERVAVFEEYRSRRIGEEIMRYVVSEIEDAGAVKAVLNAQSYTQGFYEKLGFSVIGEEFMEAGIPHVEMERRLTMDGNAELMPSTREYALTGDDNAALHSFYISHAIELSRLKSIEDLALYLKENNPLSGSFRERITKFGMQGNEIGAFLLKNIDMPYSVDVSEGERYAEYLLLCVATGIGLPYGFKSQDNGVIISDITPRKADATSQLGTGAVDGLVWHSEDAHATYNCDIIALYGMRGDPNAKTLISQVNPNELPKDVLDELQKPAFFIFSDGSHSVKNGIKSPVVSKSPYDSSKLRYDPLYTEVDTPAATEALQGLTAWINGNYRGFTVGESEMLLIDNRTSVHARSKFTPRYDGTDRWLKRLRIHQNNVPEELLVDGKQLEVDI